jgi:WD40 repeat protein
VAWGPYGTKLASGRLDKIVKLWETSTGTSSGKCQSTLSGHSNVVTSVAWNNDGSKLATGSWDKTVKVWSVGSAGTFECESTLNGYWDFVMSVAWNNDGTKLASGSDDETVLIWSVGSAGTFECESTLSGHSRYVTAVSYCFLFSNVWWMLTIEHFTAMSRVFVSVQTGNTLPVAARTKPSRYGRRRLASACRR